MNDINYRARDSYQDANYRPTIIQHDEDWGDNEEEQRITERQRGDARRAALKESSERQRFPRFEDVSTPPLRSPSLRGDLQSGVRYVKGLSKPVRMNDPAREHHSQRHSFNSDRQGQDPLSMPYSPGFYSAAREPNTKARSQHHSYPSERGAGYSPTSPRHNPSARGRHAHFTTSEINRDEYASEMGMNTKRSDIDAKNRFSRGLEDFESLGPTCTCDNDARVKVMGFKDLQDQVEELRGELRNLIDQKDRNLRSDRCLDEFTSAFTSRVDGSNALINEFGKMKINELLKQQQALDTSWLYPNEDADRSDSRHREATDPRTKEVLDLHHRVRKVLDVVTDLKRRPSRRRRDEVKDDRREGRRSRDKRQPFYRITYYIVGKVP